MAFKSKMVFLPEMTFSQNWLFGQNWLFSQKWLFCLKYFCQIWSAFLARNGFLARDDFFFQMNLSYFSKYWKVWLAFNGWKLSGLFFYILFCNNSSVKCQNFWKICKTHDKKIAALCENVINKSGYVFFSAFFRKIENYSDTSALLHFLSFFSQNADPEVQWV